MTSGSSATSSTRCPRAITSAGSADAAMAEAAGGADVRTGAGDARDTGHRAARTPGRRRVAVTGLVLVRVGLARVLRHVRVDVAHQVRAQGRGEHGRHRRRAALLVRVVELVHAHGRASSSHSLKGRGTLRGLSQ